MEGYRMNRSSVTLGGGWFRACRSGDEGIHAKSMLSSFVQRFEMQDDHVVYCTDGRVSWSRRARLTDTTKID